MSVPVLALFIGAIRKSTLEMRCSIKSVHYKSTVTSLYFNAVSASHQTVIMQKDTVNKLHTAKHEVRLIMFWCCLHSNESIAGSMKLSCIHPSVPSGRHTLLLGVCCCGTAGQEILIDCCMAGRQQQQSVNAGTATLAVTYIAEHRLVS